MALASDREPAWSAREFVFRSTILAASDSCSVIAISLTIKTMVCSTKSDRSCGSSPKATGAQAPCNSSKFRRSMKRSTISSRTGIRRRNRTRAMSCFMAIECIGARKSRSSCRWRKPSRRAPGWAVSSDRSATFFVALCSGFRRRRACDASPANATVEPVITASAGQVEITSARPLFPVQGYRAMFDIRPLDDSTDPIDLRMFLRRNGQALCETWIYQWTPPSAAERKTIMAQAGS